MRRPKKDIQLTSYDELLGLEETPEKSMNQVVEIDLAKLYPFKNHPFHVNDDEKMAETVESICSLLCVGLCNGFSFIYLSRLCV